MLWTTILLSLREIRRHLMRSFLTVLGVVIGVSAVVTMVTLGHATTKSVQSQISGLGSNLLTILPGQSLGRGGGGQGAQPFKIEDVDAIRGQIGGVTAVAPQVQSSATAVRNAANWTVTINGTTGEYLIGQQWALASGRVFTPAEEQAGKLTIAKLNIDENLDVTRRFEVMSIPTLLLFKDGQPVQRLIGAKPKGALVQEISSHLS